MSDELRFYALFGAGTALSLRMSRDGQYAFAIQGNVEPLFPPTEMGSYAGQDPGAIAGFFQMAQGVLPQCQNNARSAPGAAFMFVQDGDQKWSFDLYAPPPAFVPLQDSVFKWVNGPGRSGKAKTVQLSARFTDKGFRQRDRARFELALRSTGTQDVTVSTPRGETLRLVLAEAGPQADEENYELLTQDQLSIVLTPPSPLDCLTLSPGAQALAAVQIAKGLLPGMYRGTLTYLSQEVDVDSLRRPSFKGAVSLDLGIIRVVPDA